MKYSQLIGIAACIALIGICFIPWSYVAEINLLITGVNGGRDLGKPGLFNIILSVVLILFFLIPKLWAKRANVFIGALNIAWSIRNYLVVGACGGGICPQKKAGIFLLIFLSLFIEVMTFFPSIRLEPRKE